MLGEGLYLKVREALRYKGLSLHWKFFCTLRRVMPIRRDFGFSAGRPIDRYYVEHFFLSSHSSDIRGRVLEIGDRSYTSRFGEGRVLQSDVLHVKPGNPVATIVADLTCANQVQSATFDCVILTFTLQYIYDVRAAIRTLYRVLRPGGVILAAFPGISQISRYDMDQYGEYWRFTTLSAHKLFSEFFPSHAVKTQAYGNVLTTLAFLHGLAAEELSREELDYHDPDYEQVISVRAVKPGKNEGTSN